MQQSHRIMFTAFMTLVPGSLTAQDTSPTRERRATVSGSASASAQAQAGSAHGFSVEGRKSLAVLYSSAAERGFSTQTIANLVAEGQAKGASERAILQAATNRLAQLEATHDAMVRAGRSSPNTDEVDRGANAMARGVTSVQIERLTRGAPSDRSLTVAFEVLTDLTAKGMPVQSALTQVQTKLEQRASDAALREVSATAGLELGLQATGSRGAGAGSAGGATGTVNGTSAGSVTRAPGAGLTGTVSGAVGAVIRKP